MSGNALIPNIPSRTDLQLRPALPPGFFIVIMLSPLALQTGTAAPSAIHIIHENDTWVAPLRAALEARSLPYREWFIDELALDLGSVPPEGVFYNRMSASSHTRDHRHAWEATRGLMAWLQAHGRRVVNNRVATGLEVSKVEQTIGLAAHGLRVPKSMAATGVQALRDAAVQWDSPFILKPNRGGKGTGVRLIRNAAELEVVLADFGDYTLDGTVILQEYVRPVDGRVLRMEFVGGEHIYTVSIDAGGGFELCPADGCQVGNAYCPADGRAQFEILADHHPEELARCQDFLRNSGMEVAAMEAAPDAEGRLRFYDVNINTNYNAGAEERAGVTRTGMGAIADFLGREWRAQEAHQARLQRRAS